MQNQLDSAAFDDVLGSLRVAGTIVLAESYGAPWTIDIPAGESIRPRTPWPEPTRIVPFHMVRAGGFRLERDSHAPLAIRSGEAVLCLGGRAHRMQGAGAGRPVHLTEILDDAKHPPAPRGGDDDTTLICGLLALRNPERNPLLESLPEVIHLPMDRSATLAGLAELVAEEAGEAEHGSRFMADRLVELFCAEAVRTWLRDHPTTADANWARGVTDPIIGRALNIMHREFDRPLTVDAIADRIGLSPSRFAARFRERIGLAPKRYLRRWRMTRAIELIESTGLPIAEVADRVGYANFAAFSRAFKADTQRSPGSYRS